MGFWYPSAFASVLSLSGSFFWYPDWPTKEAGLSDETGWLTSQLARHRREPLRWFVSTGRWEGDALWENRRVRDVLIAKGYPLKYVEYSRGAR
jgi:enterochelin esterase-like enzyme